MSAGGPQAVLFDLDGTLVDSRPGIVAALNATLGELGEPERPEAELIAHIGPPLPETFGVLLGRPPAELAEVVRAYRARYATLMLTGTLVYPGVERLLADLRAEGRTLAVATSKAQDLALALLEHLGLAGHFAVIRGTVPPAEEEKARTVARALDALGLLPGGHAVLVGDRRHDAEGGRANGLRVIGAGWGYGPPGELEAAGVAAVAATPADVPLLLSGRGSASSA